MSRSNLSAVVVAAGKSSRFSQHSSDSKSKVLTSIQNKPLFLLTLEALFVLSIERLSLVIRPEDESFIRGILESAPFRDRIVIAYGGARRQDSVRNGLAPLGDEGRVFIHDAARPFVSAEFLKELDIKSEGLPALIPVLPIVETIKEVDETGKVIRTHDRSRFFRVQTPQFFQLKSLKDVHHRFKDAATAFPDDAAMMEAASYLVHTARGRMENIKVTYPEDLAKFANS